MREMKDSGIDVIGAIPNTWNLRRLKYLCNIQTGNEDTQNADPEGEYPFYVRSPIIEKCTRYTFDGEGILMAGDGAGAGRIFHHVYGKYAVHQRVYRLSRFKNIDTNYFYYFLSNIFPKIMDKGSAQSTVPSVRLPMLLNCEICLPPLSEQYCIAAYLDAKCAEIDSLSTDIQTQIDTLEQYKRSAISEAITKGLIPDAELKDRGIFYMSPTNANWKLTKIGYICKKLSRSFQPQDTALICSNKGKILVRPDDMTGKMVSEDNAMQGICKGDIAIHGMDTWHGAIAISQLDGKITRVVHVCDSSEDKRFIAYYLQHLSFQGVYKLISNGVRGNTSDFRSWEKVSDIYICLPKTLDEQKEISDYLDGLCDEIDKIIRQRCHQLDLLEEYKKSLIFEYVTGKKEVV